MRVFDFLQKLFVIFGTRFFVFTARHVTPFETDLSARGGGFRDNEGREKGDQNQVFDHVAREREREIEPESTCLLVLLVALQHSENNV